MKNFILFQIVLLSSTCFAQIGTWSENEYRQQAMIGWSVDLDADGNTIASCLSRYSELRIFRFDGVDQWVQMGQNIKEEMLQDTTGICTALLSENGNSVAFCSSYGNGFVSTYEWNGSTWGIIWKQNLWE